MVLPIGPDGEPAPAVEEGDLQGGHLGTSSTSLHEGTFLTTYLNIFKDFLLSLKVKSLNKSLFTKYCIGIFLSTPTLSLGTSYILYFPFFIPTMSVIYILN